MIRLATTNFGQPYKLYGDIAGEIIAADGRRIEFDDVPHLICAAASYAILEIAAGHGATAQRFEQEARQLFSAYEQAKRWRSCSGVGKVEMGT